jgi:hypothetical protein
MMHMIHRNPAILICSVLLIFGCKPHPQQAGITPAPKADSSQNTVADREQAFMTRDKSIEDTLGHKISTVNFSVKAVGEDLKIYEDGMIPSINLDNPKKRIKNLADRDEMVIPYQKVILKIDYPLTKPVFIELTSQSKGFTRQQIILEISKRYHQLYDEEERSATIKTVPAEQRKTTYNRNETDGKYGIWGHDLSDLELSSIDIYQNADGRIFLTLDIES